MVKKFDPKSVAYIGAAVNNLRIEQGLTVDELVEKSGVTRYAIRNWMLGTHAPYIPYLLKVLAVFDAELLVARKKTRETLASPSAPMPEPEPEVIPEPAEQRVLIYPVTLLARLDDVESQLAAALAWVRQASTDLREAGITTRVHVSTATLREMQGFVGLSEECAETIADQVHEVIREIEENSG